MEWIIVNQDGDRWSNELGWCYAEFDVFSESEKKRLRLPIGGKWKPYKAEGR